MKELLLWIIGTQKINSLDSTLYCAIKDGDIEGESSEQVLNQLIEMSSVEKAEKLSHSSGGLRTIRALYYALYALKNIGNADEILAFTKLEYPYALLVSKGKVLDDAIDHELATSPDIIGTSMEDFLEDEEEEDEEIEDEDDEDEG